MPDWRAYVRENLDRLPGSPAEQRQVVRELAEHLEEYYLATRANGLSEKEAFANACAQAGNWEELRRGITLAQQEEIMQERVRQIWLPGLVTLLASYFVLAALQRAAMRYFAAHPGIPHGVVYYVPWLLLLPLVGAIGGYLSRRARGTGYQAYFAVLVPALGIGTFFLFLFLLAFVIGPRITLATKVSALAMGIINWAIFPGAALCAGAALQSLRRKNAVSSRGPRTV